MSCGEFIAGKPPVSDRYATDSPVGANDEGTANQNGEEKELGEKKELGSSLGIVSDSCGGVVDAGEGTGLGTCWCHP